MEVMGLVDQDAAISEGQEDNPVPLDDLLWLLTTAIRHFCFQQYRQVGISDGHYTLDKLPQCTTGQEPIQCGCSAHLEVESYTDEEKKN